MRLTLAGFAILLLLALSTHSSSLVTLGVRYDLHRYAKVIRACDRSLVEKERLLDLIDGIEQRFDAGYAISLPRWLADDDAIRAILDGGITSDDVRLIERELEKMRWELSQGSQ